MRYPVLIQEPERLVRPWLTPPLPAEASVLAASGQVAPYLLEDRFQDELERPLHHPVADSGDRESTATAAFLRYLHFPQPLGAIHIGANLRVIRG